MAVTAIPSRSTTNIFCLAHSIIFLIAFSDQTPRLAAMSDRLTQLQDTINQVSDREIYPGSVHSVKIGFPSHPGSIMHLHGFCIKHFVPANSNWNPLSPPPASRTLLQLHWSPAAILHAQQVCQLRPDRLPDTPTEHQPRGLRTALLHTHQPDGQGH